MEKSLTEIDKKVYLTEIGKILLADLGKKEFYKPKEVEIAHDKSKWSAQLEYCYSAICIYSTHAEFDAYTQKNDLTYDYVQTRLELLDVIAQFGSNDYLDSVDIDMSWLDFGDGFDGIIEGVGEFVTAIFEGI